MTKTILGYTLAQWLVAIATLGGIFLARIQPDLIDLGVKQSLMDIGAQILTFVLGVGLFLKSGSAAPDTASVGK